MNIIHRIRRGVASLIVVAVLLGGAATAVLVPVTVNADPATQINNGVNAVDGGADSGDLTGLIKNIINILLFIVGVAAVIMIIIGGLRYTTSGGDSSSITAAKNTILYSIVGLIVAAMAFAIVNFVVDKL